MADFVLGYPSNFQQSASQHNNVQVPVPALYFNDAWRVNRRVTLSYGLRWEPYYAVRDLNGYNLGFRRDLYERGVRSQVYLNAPPGIVFKGDPGFPTTTADSEDNLLQFAPRLGVVWDPTGDNRQTIRAGGGLYFNASQTWHHSLLPNAPPWGNSTNAIRPGQPNATIAGCPSTPGLNDGCPVNFLDPWSATPGGDPTVGFTLMGEPKVLPPANAPFPLGGGYQSFPLDFRNTRVYQFNLSYQRQLPARVLVEVTYTGNVTRNIITGYQENPIVYIPGNCQAGQYASDRAGAVLEHDGGEPHRAANSDAAESDSGAPISAAGSPRRTMAPEGTTTASSSR